LLMWKDLDGDGGAVNWSRHFRFLDEHSPRRLVLMRWLPRYGMTPQIWYADHVGLSSGVIESKLELLEDRVQGNWKWCPWRPMRRVPVDRGQSVESNGLLIFNGCDRSWLTMFQKNYQVVWKAEFNSESWGTAGRWPSKSRVVSQFIATQLLVSQFREFGSFSNLSIPYAQAKQRGWLIMSAHWYHQKFDKIGILSRYLYIHAHDIVARSELGLQRNTSKSHETIHCFEYNFLCLILPLLLFVEKDVVRYFLTVLTTLLNFSMFGTRPWKELTNLMKQGVFRTWCTRDVSPLDFSSNRGSCHRSRIESNRWNHLGRTIPGAFVLIPG
jgi:hypothetical protein